MNEFKLPDLGEGIHEAEILKWHVTRGDSIKEDEPLVDVETDKAAVTIPSPWEGTVVQTTGDAGDIVQVGDVLVVFGDPSQAAKGNGATKGRTDGTTDRETERARVTKLEGKAERETERARVTKMEGPGRGETLPRPPAAPATRRLARELAVSLADVTPTGPGGRVTADDVRRFAEVGATGSREAEGPEPEPAKSLESRPAEVSGAEPVQGALPKIPFYSYEPLPDQTRFGPVERVPFRSIRRRVARKMVTSLVVVPHVVHWDEADVTELQDFRRRYVDRHPEGPRLSVLPFAIKAVTAALKQFPIFNASLDSEAEEILLKKYINIGVAADTAQGLVVPVLRGTDQMSVHDVARGLEALVARARAGEGRPDDFQGGSFTITNMGPLGGVPLAPAINYPEVAILGMGRIQEKPVIRDGAVVARSMLPVTLGFDHRVADGGDAARFVGRVVELLSEPDRLFVEG